MMDNNQHSIELSKLILELIDGSIEKERLKVLEECLLRSPDELNFYREFIKNTVVLKSRISFVLNNDSECLNSDLWLELAEYEKTASAIVIPKEKPKKELIQKVEYPKLSRRKKLSKWEIGYMVTAAAVIFMVLFIRFAPPKGGIEIATLTDNVNAKWASVTGSMEKGTRLATRSDKLFLREGLAELLFDNGTKVVIEGPAEFELLTEGWIDLQYGRIYATVPPEAVGFTINTPTSRIVDLGTEFGVWADAYGDVQLHVIKGKTMLIAGDRSHKANIEVQTGQAKKVSGTTLNVSDISCNAELFVRDMRSEQHYAWRRQMEINLADIVGGGNGFGTGKLDWAINPSNGEQTSICEALRKEGQNKLIPISWSDYIDGVFTIGQGLNPVPVTSQGHLFEECPDTSGTFWGDIVNGAKVVQYTSRVPYSEFQNQGKLQGQPFGTLANPSIFMVPNMGITFDLEEIRRSLPSGLKVISFSCLYGLCDSDAEIGRSDFWVLVDGRVRDQQAGLQSNGEAIPASVPLKDTDRFLTLITTDNDGIGTRDWCLFARPMLHVEMRQ